MTGARSILNAILVYLLLFTSGSVLYEKNEDKFFVVALIFSLLAWALFSDRKINVKFALYVCVFTCFLLVISLYTKGSLSFFSVLSLSSKLVLAYLILKTVGHNFTDTFIQVVVFLAVFSLFGYLSDVFGLFDAVIRNLYRVGDGRGYEGIFYIYRYHVLDRNSSIFFEPGAYQGFLNAAIFMLFFLKTKYDDTRRWAYILILLVTLFTTFSTTGYLICAMTFGLFFYRGKMLSVTGKLILAGVLVVGLAVFSTKFHSVIVVKINDYMSGPVEEHGYSADRRRFDAKVDLEIFKKHIFGAGFTKYMEERIVIGNHSGGSSNGVTRILAIYGLPFALFIFYSYYWAFGVFSTDLLMRVVPFGMFLIFLMGESYYISAPFSLAVIAAAFVFGRSAIDEHARVQ